MSEEEKLLNLYDYYWFQWGVFTAKPLLSAVGKSPVRDVRMRENDQVSELDDEPITTQMRKCQSEGLLISEHHLGNLTNMSSASASASTSASASASPKSVLAPQLHSIMSGNSTNSSGTGRHSFHKRYRHRSARKKTGSRNLSELELEELKGFMELGFAFSGENMNPRLVSIVPGLQKLVENREESDQTGSITRPYLSEAWDCLEYEETEMVPLMDLRIPDFQDEIELKDHLRSWAHMVASSIRR